MAERKLATTIVIGGAVSGALGAALGRTQSQLRDLGSNVRQLAARQREMASSTGKNTAEYRALTAQVDRLRAAQSRLAQVERQRQANMDRREQLRGEIGDAAGTAAAVNLPIIGSVQQAAEFGYNLQLIGNTADMTGEQVRGLGASIMQISRETATSAPDVQRAMGFLIAAGMDAGKAQAQLSTIAKTAKATGSDVEDVARSAFTLGDSLKIEPGNMTAALEALVQAGKEGNFEFRDMATELPGLGAGFAALKMTGQDAVATMGAALQIARKGAGSSSEAANNLSNFMAKLLSPETLKKAERLGSDLYGVVAGAQARGENPFDAAIAEIDRITKGGDQKLLGELFGDMQVQGFLRPMLQNLEEFERVRARSLSASGVIDEDFAKMKGTLKAQLGEIGNAIQRAAIKIGEALRPVIEKASTVLVPIIDGIAAFASENPKLVGGLLAAASALSVLGVAVKVGAFAFTYLRGAWLDVQRVMAGAKVGAVLSSMGTVGSTLGMIGTTIAQLGAGPLIAIGAAIAGIVAAVVKFWPYIQSFAGGYFTGLGDALAGPWERLKTALGPLGSALGTLWGWFTQLFTPINATTEELNGATSAGRTFGQMAGTVLGGIIDVAALAVNAFVGLGEAIGTAAGWITVKLGAAIDWLLPKIQPLLAGVGFLAGKAGELGGMLGLGEPADPSTLPQPAMRGAGGAVNSNNNSTTVGAINVQAAPGQSAREVAVEVDKRLRERERENARGAMFDPVAG